MAKSNVSTSGRQTVRWSTLPAESEIMSMDALLFGRNDAAFGDELLFKCLSALVKNPEKINRAKFLLNTSVLEFRQYFKKVTHNEVKQGAVNGFKKATQEYKDYLWKIKGLKNQFCLNTLGNVFFGVSYQTLIKYPDRHALKIRTQEECHRDLLALDLSEELLEKLYDVRHELIEWVSDKTLFCKKTMMREIYEGSLSSLTGYPMLELMILNRVSRSASRGDRNRYQNLTIGCFITFGVPLSELMEKHDKGILFAIRSKEEILAFQNYRTDLMDLNQVLNYYFKLQEGYGIDKDDGTKE